MKTNGEWMDKPITWRTYLRLSGIITVISLLGSAIYYAIYFWDEITEKLDNLTIMVKRKLNRN